MGLTTGGVRIRIPKPLDHQEMILDDGSRFKIAVCGRRFGKAVCLETRLPVPGGWLLMGEVCIGDELFDIDGERCLVIGVSEVQYGRDCYEVLFSDGSSVIADGEHLWVTDSMLERKTQGSRRHATDARRIRRGPSVRTTEEIGSTLFVGPRGDRNHSVMTCGSISCEERVFPVVPYTLGCWLGDGNSRCSQVTNGDIEVFAGIESDGYSTTLIASGTNGTATCKRIGESWTFRNASGQYENGGGFFYELRKLGLVCNKHIPSCYLRGSTEQRLELLRGLMDTDGTVRPNGYCEFDNTNKRLSDGVYELVCSLGWKAYRYDKVASLYGKDCGTCYRVSFTPSEYVFKIERKRERQILSGINRLASRSRRYIKSVTLVDSVPVKCITVDSPSRTYLVTDSFIPTHNSVSGAIAAVRGHGPYRGDGRWKFPGALQGGNIAWITSTNKNANHVIWPMLRKMLKPLWDGGGGLKSEQDKSISFPGENGGKVTVWSAEAPDSIRGDGLDGIVYDECAFATDYLWFDVLRPALIDTGGWAIFATTPNGRNWLHKLFEASKVRDGWSQWQLPTMRNPTIDPLEIAEIREEARLFGRSIEQEIDAEFDTPSGRYFKMEDFQKTIWPTEFLSDPGFNKGLICGRTGWPTNTRYIVQSVDTSYGGDFQAIANVGWTGDSFLYVQFGISKTTASEFARKIVRMAMNLPVHPTYTFIEEQVNKSSGSGQIEDLVHGELGKRFTTLNVINIPPSSHEFVKAPSGGFLKQHRITALTTLIENKAFRFIDTPETRIGMDQLIDFSVPPIKGVNDDCPDALARCIDGVRRLLGELADDEAPGWD